MDGDGHLVEDHQAIWERMPAEYRDLSFVTTRSAFPPNDHLHAANKHFLPEGAFARVGREGWQDFLQDVGVDRTVLYTSAGLAFGRVVSRDWAIELARAYNNWVYDAYVSRDSRFQAVGLIPLQEPAEAAIELRRIVKDLGFVGAMLPGTGALQLQNHLGDPKYWPIYEEADRLGCAIGIHGGVHDHMGLDDMSPYAPAWFVGCLERFQRSWDSHIQYDPNGRFMDLKNGESVTDYILRHVDEGRVFIGVEGDELTLPFAVRIAGNKPFIFSSDFPHEVNHETCKEELAELRDNPNLSSADKAGILYANSERFYRLSN